ncbi:unnamed protein product [Gemmata massiliana]|uniref:Uncharacterized protein n=1 Tax=Gemmata massiliana TaxID=1210884 RepID=A0A6P2D7W1_9BACT|nr:hypothetical protein [Gemmata massiliana]VTR97017.1 unnamed protein product [Gemmata massiliana]
MPRDTDEWVTLTPVQLAVLLDLPREDSVYLSVAPVRLPLAWYNAWNERLGPRDLTPAEVVMITGLSAGSVRWALRQGMSPHLAHRVVGFGPRPRRLIAPAAVIHFIRELNNNFNNRPVMAETLAQKRRHAVQSRTLSNALFFKPDKELVERLKDPRPVWSGRSKIELYFTIHRKCCPAIAVNGFPVTSNGCFGSGVYLELFSEVRPKPGCQEVEWNQDIDPLDSELVVFEFRVPTKEAKPFARGGYDYLPPDHPDFDLVRDTPDPYYPDRAPDCTWVVPPELANRYCHGLRFWSGKRPLTDEELKMIDARRAKPRRLPRGRKPRVGWRSE